MSSSDTSRVPPLTKEDAKIIVDHVDELYKFRQAWHDLASAYWGPLSFPQLLDPKIGVALEEQQKKAFNMVDQIVLEIEQLAPQYSAAKDFLKSNS